MYHIGEVSSGYRPIFFLSALVVVAVFYTSNVRAGFQTQDSILTTSHPSIRGPARDYYAGPDFCNYNDLRFIKEGDILKISDCETCTCNTTLKVVTCKFHTCLWNHCSKQVSIPGECCKVCAYHVPVYNMELENPRIVRGWKFLSYYLEFDLRIEINTEGHDVKGDKMWRVAMWFSGRRNGKGKKIGKTYQVLTEEQDSLTLSRSMFLGGFNFTIPNVRYDLTSIQKDLCSTYRYVAYICIKFAPGKDAIPENADIPFIVEGVASAWNLSAKPSRLTKCVPYIICKGEESHSEIWKKVNQTYPDGACPPPDVLNIDPLKPAAEFYKHGQMITLRCKAGYYLEGSDILVCTNKNTWHRKYPECIEEVVETTEATLPPPTTTETTQTKAAAPVHLAEVVVVKTNDVLHVSLDVRFQSQLPSGTPLEVRTWASSYPDGSGKKTGFRSQVVDVKPSSLSTSPDPPASNSDDFNGIKTSNSTDNSINRTSLFNDTVENLSGPTENTNGETNPASSSINEPPNNAENADGYEVSISHVNFDLNTLNTSCNEIKYLCAAVGIGDVTSNETFAIELVGCQPFTDCEDIPVYRVEVLAVDSVTADYNNTINTALQISVHGHGDTAASNAFWRVAMWASPDVKGREQIGFIKQVLNYNQTSKRYTRPHVGPYQIHIPDISFTLDTSNASCHDLKYICASIGTSDMIGGNNQSNIIPFIIYGVEAVNDSTPNPDKLIGCNRITNCNAAVISAWPVATKEPAEQDQGCLPLNVANGSFIVPHKDLYEYEDEVIIQCNDGSILIGNETMTCTRNGTWTDWTSYCMFQGCPRPLTENASILYPDQQWYTYGETIRLTIPCPASMELSSHYEEFVCTDNGTWYREIPHCINKTQKAVEEGCLRPDTGNGGIIHPKHQQLYHYGQQVNISCKAGFYLKGNSTIICGETGDWYFKIPRCVKLGIKLGKPSVTTSIGARNKECARPHTSTGSTLTPDKKIYKAGQHVKVVCHEDYQLFGKKEIVCSKTGTWNGNIGKCNPMQKGCKKPRLSIGAKLYPYKKWYSHGQTVHINCTENFRLGGEPQLVCLDTGEWHREAPKCEISVDNPNGEDEGHASTSVNKYGKNDYIITPLIITLSAIAVLLILILIFLNFVSDDYKPTPLTPKLIHRTRKKKNYLRTPSVGPADKCNGMLTKKRPPLAKWEKI